MAVAVSFLPSASTTGTGTEAGGTTSGASSVGSLAPAFPVPCVPALRPSLEAEGIGALDWLDPFNPVDWEASAGGATGLSDRSRQIFLLISY